MAKGRRGLNGKQKRWKCGPQIEKKHRQILSVSILHNAYGQKGGGKVESQYLGDKAQE